MIRLWFLWHSELNKLQNFIYSERFLDNKKRFSKIFNWWTDSVYTCFKMYFTNRNLFFYVLGLFILSATQISVHSAIRPSVYNRISTYPSVPPSIRQCFHISVYPSDLSYIRMSSYPSVPPLILSAVYPSLHLSVRPPVFLYTHLTDRSFICPSSSPCKRCDLVLL